MKTAAIYARVSSDQQKESNTIASQTATLVAFAETEGYSVPADGIFEASPTKVLCLTAFPTPHGRPLRDG